jgi:hypothetical protein
MPGRRPKIIRRLDAALDIMDARNMAVRAIYLTEKDWTAYDRAQSRAYGAKLCCFQYSDHPIRRGKESKIYSTNGVAVSVPKDPPA